MGTIYEFLSAFFIILLLLTFFYGQNWQGWYAGRQIKRSLKELEEWKNYGIGQLLKVIEPLSGEDIAQSEIIGFIHEMLEFFVISPSNLDPPVYEKINFLYLKKEARYIELIKRFLPKINDLNLYRIASLLRATTEIDLLCKNVQHNLIVGKKTKSYLYLLQTASDITQTMLHARSYRIALDTFMFNYPLGDSIGPLAVRKFVEGLTLQNSDNKREFSLINNDIVSQSIKFEGRDCICLRAKGPECRVGNPGRALKQVFETLQSQGRLIHLIVTIDSYSRLEVEKSGTIAQGLGVAVGSGKSVNLEKYEIETLAIRQDPQIPIEAIVCRESLDEAVLPMTEQIEASVPKIERLLKQIIRTQTAEGHNVIIIGIGNANGISP